MKSYVQIAIAVFCITAVSCGKRVTPLEAGPLYTGKVVKTICGNIVVQFVDGSNLGQMNWEDNGVSYNNIFSVANPCTWGTAREGTIFKFRFVPVVPQTCANCLVYTPVPDTMYHIRVFR